jgi:S-adenosylmethionine:tRNA ribosyltransferase-isomerase
MKTADFDFPLPLDRIADHPARPRDGARLLVVNRSGRSDRILRDLPGLLKPHDLLVFNDTRVIPARLTGQRGVARVEVTLHKREADGRWWAFARPAKRLRPGDRIAFADDFGADVAAKGEGGEVLLDFAAAGCPPEALPAALRRHGVMPLPPYIRRPNGPEPGDAEDYQTVFAAADGAVAAPTAGLHFTPPLLAALAEAGIATTTVTLHVGAGTFLPVKTEDLGAHRMHAELGEISAAAVEAVAAARRAGGRVIAVGTTTLRLLETVADADGRLRPFVGETDIFITPGARFRIIDLLLTNFHLPRSTLFMLVSAFAGVEPMREAYAHAIATGYRFYSFGDACLLERAL